MPKNAKICGIVQKNTIMRRFAEFFGNMRENANRIIFQTWGKKYAVNDGQKWRTYAEVMPENAKKCEYAGKCDYAEWCRKMSGKCGEVRTA